MIKIGTTLAALAVLLGCGAADEGGMTSAPPGHDSVSIVSNAFTPRAVIPNGAGVVTWTWNAGGVTHNVTFEALLTGSGDRSSGTFSQTFTEPGTYRYRCTIHSSSFTSGMTGTVVLGTVGDPKDPYDPY